ncbi:MULTISPECIES: hypothetical protein [unclassified Streptomyces]|uniref:hypothetical protein n=1 Tax=unclassified Streptomyces TaxID=2593676 RepID=UPI0033CB8D08
MSARLVRPAPEIVARRAREILTIVEADREFDRLRTACAKYDEDWQSFTGYALVDGFDVGGCWFGREETARRKAVVTAKYGPIGVLDGGRRFAPGFPMASQER